MDAGVHSVREISERSGLSKSIVSRVRHRLLNGGTIERKIGSGSLQHLSGVALQTVRDLVEGSVATGGSVSTAKLRSEIEERTGEGVSRMTLCRALHREGFSAKRRRVGPALMARHRDAQQVWSLLHRDDQFDATVFIDEANFQIHRNTQVVWCRPLLINISCRSSPILKGIDPGFAKPPTKIQKRQKHTALHVLSEKNPREKRFLLLPSFLFFILGRLSSHSHWS